MTLQEKLHKQRRSILLLFIAGLILQVFMSVSVTSYNLSRELVDLASRTWILVPNIPKDDNAGRQKLEEKILQGLCKVQDPACGTWVKVKRYIDFSKMKEVEDRAYLITSAHIPEGADYVINLGDAYGEYSGWINGKYIGKTSRLEPLQQKKFLFTNTDALFISRDLRSKTGETSIVVRADRWTEVDYPPFFRIYNFSIVEYSWFMYLEQMTHHVLVFSSISILLFGLYHFAVWLRRRQASYFAFVIYCVGCCLQNASTFGISRFWGMPEWVNLRTRLVLVTILGFIYIVFQVMVDSPLSYFYEYLKYKRKRKERGSELGSEVLPAFANFGILKKIVCAVGEFLFYVYMPFMVVISIFLPQAWLGIITYKFSVYIVLLLNLGGVIAIIRWFYVNATKKSVVNLIPAGLGAVVLNTAIFQTVMYNTFGFRLAGTPQGTATVVVTIILFAVSLGNQFSGIFHTLQKLKLRLEVILSGTKELSTIYEKAAAATKAARYVLEAIKSPNKISVKISLVQESLADDTYLEAYLITENEDVIAPTLKVQSNLYLSAIPKEKILKGGCWLHGDSIIMPIVYGKKNVGFLIFENYAEEEISADDAHFIDTLSSSLAVALTNIAFLQETTEKARLNAELSAAQAVQKALLPEQIIYPNLEIATVYRAAAQTGGDWFGYYYNEDSHNVDLFIGDVTGHGIPAALLTGVICGTIYSCEKTFYKSQVTDDKLAMERNIERLSTLASVANHLVLQTGKKSQLLMTMLFISIDMETGKCLILNAAHNHPLLVGKNSRTIKTIAASGNRLGYKSDLNFKVKEFQLEPGDSIFMYTDGLIENTGAESAATFAERMLKKHLLETTDDHAVQHSLDKIINAADKIWQGAPPADDVSVFFCKWKGPISREEFQEELLNQERN